MDSELEFRKLKWASRRGMLELDVLIGPFTEHHYKTLSEPLKVSYRAFLSEEDADLWGWLQGTLATPNDDYATLVAAINEQIGAGQVR